MKRSEIDAYIDEFLSLTAERQFHLPPWATWSPSQWAEIGEEADEIRQCGLGWDVTDFGSGKFAQTGLALFNLRNGLPQLASAGGKDYCEKIMMVRPGQLTPYHFHLHKMEDIINRGGGRLILKLYNSTADEALDQAGDVIVQIDSITQTLPCGGEVVLAPGQSIALTCYLYHAFWGDPETEPVLVGEVSRINDDEGDNRFLESLSRFPDIEEDAPPRYCLCTEYPPAAK